MADKRMFAKSIVDSDAFLDMPITTQCLYFHLCMRADDDGFVSNPKRIQRMLGVGDDDMRVLVSKRFILSFQSGIVVIKHWRLHNSIRKDTYHETLYTEEKHTLYIKPDGAYTDHPLQPRNELSENPLRARNDQQIEAVPQIRLDKDRLDKDRLDKDSNFTVAMDNPAPVITMMLNDKSEYPIYKEKVDEWSELYPGVDVMQQLRNMKGWCKDNPTKRKTQRGIMRFCNSWLAREQDKGYQKPSRNQTVIEKVETADAVKALNVVRGRMKSQNVK